MAQTVKRLSTMRETPVQSLGWEDPPEEMATHSRTIAWMYSHTTLRAWVKESQSRVTRVKYMNPTGAKEQSDDILEWNCDY